MKLFPVLAVLASLCPAQTWLLQETGARASLRGISPVNSRVVWASGTSGTWLRTIDGGTTWQKGVVPGADKLDFRGVRAFDDHTAFLLSAGTGDQSRVFSTSDAGAHWTLLFTNPDPTGFFDAIAFRDPQHGIILGDPVDGFFTIFTTEDGGRHWVRRETPPALPGEGAFAASNSCLTSRKNQAIFGTGGARVFRSLDSGQTWTVAQTGIRHDSDSAGIFSLAFADASHGIAVGGNYSKDTESRDTAAITSDGGATWVLTNLHGYRSAVAYLPDGKAWIATGTSGSDLSKDGGKTWTLFDRGAFHALGVSPDGAVWASGPDGRIARLTQ
jgi:photosystem II stability/assembly factor-like uncharacterized protein